MKRIIAVSKIVKDRLVRVGVPSDKIEVIYNPIDTDAFRPANKHKCREMLNLPKKATILGSYGRLNPDKGFEIFLKAAVTIKKTFKRTYFLIAGKEWEKDYRARLIKLSEELGLVENFILLDWQENAQALICSADILLLLPLEYEAFPRTLAEGMACEVPVIGTSVGGITELIEHGRDGLIVPPDNATSVVEAVHTLLKDKKLANRLAKNGRQKARTMLQREQHALKIERIYTTLLIQCTVRQ
jgi:glycosyltransferase involved in cell wall biosynthesis